MFSIRIIPAGVSLAVSFVSIAAVAQETVLDPIVVTATRTARTVDDTLAPVTVIRRADIERTQARSVVDVLRGTPGVSFSSYGGAGKITSLFLRGTNSSHVLVLIDGVKIGSATDGSAALQDIPIDQVERIEIVRGPRSSLYGSEAIGGVVQIFTRRGRGPATPEFALSAGSQSSAGLSAGVSGGDAKHWYGLNLTSERTSGFNTCTGSAVAFGGCFTDEPDDDGYRNSSIAARGGLRLEDRVELEAHAMRARAFNEYDGSFQNQTRSVQQVIGTRATVKPLEAWQATLKLAQSRDFNDNYQEGAFASRFETTRDAATLQNDVTLGENHLLTLGFEWQRDAVDSDVAYLVDSRINRAAFAEWQRDFERHHLQASLRGDDNSQFGRHGTGGLAWGYEVADTLRLNASYGTAFKAPTFNDLYFPPDPFFGGGGNPDLRPEKSRSYEVGLAATPAWGRWGVNLFRTEIRDLIGFDASFIPANIDRARITGVEASVSRIVMGTRVQASLTFLDPENRGSGANGGNMLPRRARQTGRLEVDRGIGDWSFGATLVAEGKRYDDLANTKKLGGFATLDLRAEWAFRKHWKLQLRMANALDKEYETAQWYPQSGRSWLLTLRYQPQR